MKKIILLTFLLFATFQFSVAQNTIAKLKFEEAEEAYVNNNFELALTKLKEVETLLKSTNPRILYLQILCQDKIISKDLMANYAIIENIRASFNKYLIDYENLPDNEDKYRDIYKISEKYNDAPISLKDFNDRINQIELKKAKKEQGEIEKSKNGEEAFMNFTFFNGYKSGLSLEEAKLEYSEFFKRAKKSDVGVNSNIYLNKDDMISQLFVKNGKLAGNHGKLIKSIADDANFSKGIKAISDIVNDLTKQFNINPTETIHKFEKDGFIMNTSTFIWQKNGKSIVIKYEQTGRLNYFWSTAVYTQFDKNYHE